MTSTLTTRPAARCWPHAMPTASTGSRRSGSTTTAIPTAAAPHEVQVSGGCGAPADGYFSRLPTAAASCKVDVSAEVNWGTRDDPPNNVREQLRRERQRRPADTAELKTPEAPRSTRAGARSPSPQARTLSAAAQQPQRRHHHHHSWVTTTTTTPPATAHAGAHRACWHAACAVGCSATAQFLLLDQRGTDADPIAGRPSARGRTSRPPGTVARRIRDLDMPSPSFNHPRTNSSGHPQPLAAPAPCLPMSARADEPGKLPCGSTAGAATAPGVAPNRPWRWLARTVAGPAPAPISAHQVRPAHSLGHHHHRCPNPHTPPPAEKRFQDQRTPGTTI